MNIYKEAILQNLHFSTASGAVSVSDMAKFSKEALNSTYLRYKAKLNETEDNGLLQTSSPLTAVTELRLAIIKDLVEYKLEEEKNARQASSNRERRQYLLGIKANNKFEREKGMSDAEIDKELADL